MTVLKQFNTLLLEASQWPKFFWFHNFLLAKQSFLLDLEEIKKDINKDNASYKKLETFINILKKEEIAELELAEGFALLADIFSLSEFTQQELLDFQNLAQAFLKRVRNENKFQELRAKLIHALSLKQQKEYDQKLFNNEGINYCLEYYLSFYKSLADLKATAQKKEFINAQEVDLGFGKVVGLKKDLEQDESLTKFILLILNDATRLELINHYYNIKNVVLKFEDVNIIEKSLKDFILMLFFVFQKQGITKLTSTFFTPYGQQPKMVDLIKIFSN